MSARLIKHQIQTDGITVWVNSGVDSSNLARFGRNGIDIHRPMSEQKSGVGECLYCTHVQVTAEDWEIFKVEILRHHGVVVTDRYKPKRFGTKGATR